MCYHKIMDLTKVIREYAQKNRYLTKPDIAEVTLYNDAGEWAVAVEYICARLTDYVLDERQPLSQQEMDELNSLVDATKRMEKFDDDYLNDVKEACRLYS